jgi:hypothetical protein
MGTAPYAFAGVCELPSPELAGQNPEAYNAALRDLPRLKSGLGTCACCGMAISSIFIVRDAAGDLYGVGCDCIRKVERDGGGLGKLHPTDQTLLLQADRARRELERNKRHAREAARRRALKDRLADPVLRERLQALPHPLNWRAAKGETALHHVQWMIGRSGAKGIAGLHKYLDRVLEQ